MAARDVLDAGTVVDRTDELTTFVSDDFPTTRDFPLPPRSVRLGLAPTPAATPQHSTPTDAPSTASQAAPTPQATPEPSFTFRPAGTTPSRTTATTPSRTAGRASSAAPTPASAPTTDAGAGALPPTGTKPAAGKAGKHRAGPPAEMKARTALIAVAAGAVAAAVSGSSASVATEPASAKSAPLAAADSGSATPALAAGSSDLDGTAVPSESKSEMDAYTSQLAVGKQLSAAAAAREAAARKPMFASPLPLGKYSFTSGYANRWGSFHGGIDLAAPLGTPIHAVSDGEVLKAGAASGYGNWIQIKAADGTVTMYGHMASSGVLVTKGQKVTAGDVIGLVGSEGFSTGPHVHFEVWKNGTSKIDPVPWLAAKGIRLASYTG